jgi:hypothetical protein
MKLANWTRSRVWAWGWKCDRSILSSLDVNGEGVHAYMPMVTIEIVIRTQMQYTAVDIISFTPKHCSRTCPGPGQTHQAKYIDTYISIYFMGTVRWHMHPSHACMRIAMKESIIPSLLRMGRCLSIIPTLQSADDICATAHASIPCMHACMWIAMNESILPSLLRMGRCLCIIPTLQSADDICRQHMHPSRACMLACELQWMNLSSLRSPDCNQQMTSAALYVHVCTCVHTHAHACTHAYIHMHTYMHARMHACIQAHIHTHACSCMWTYAHAHMHMHIHMEAQVPIIFEEPEW